MILTFVNYLIAPSEPQSTDAATKSQNKNTSTSSLPIYIGVGVSLGVLLLATVALVSVFLKRKMKK